MDQSIIRFSGSSVRSVRYLRLSAIVVVWLLAIWLQPGHLSAQVAWQRKSTQLADLPIPNPGDQQTCCVAMDVDSDGIDDFVVGERTKTPSVVWYKYNGSGWDKFVIDDTRLRPEAGGAACDVDGDGDLDLILGQDSSGSAVWWWENPSPDFDRPWKRRLLKNSGARQHHDQSVADYDGDGHIDIMIGEMGDPGAGDDAQTFIWYGDGRGHFKQTVALAGQGIHEGLLSDFNGDGRLDILVKPYHHKSPRLEVLLNRGK
jgi:hypothetical protein